MRDDSHLSRGELHFLVCTSMRRRCAEGDRNYFDSRSWSVLCFSSQENLTLNQVEALVRWKNYDID